MTVAVYLIVTAALTILAPTLMLDLIAIAYYFVTQTLVGLFGVLFVRQFSAPGLVTGLIAGNVAVLVLHFSHTNIAGINVGLIALLVNFLVTIAVSAVAKNRSSHAPMAAFGRAESRQQVEKSTT